jgi:hypothetical protein
MQNNTQKVLCTQGVFGGNEREEASEKHHVSDHWNHTHANLGGVLESYIISAIF